MTMRTFKISFLLFCFLISLNILMPHAVIAETCENADACPKPPGSSDPDPSPEPSGTQDPEPFPPGGDNPDETFAVDSGNPPLEPYFKSDPDAVVLQNGYYKSFGNLLSKLKKSGNNADLNTPPQDLLSAETVMVIPSGGLYGLENSAFFKASLDEYVKQGGTLIVFAQQHGYEFNVLPVPQEVDGTFKRVTGYGWVEDQSCFTNAVYFDTWRQMLSGQSKSAPTLSVDGYFTDYPSNATVILRRTKNGQPAMISYPYGNGLVVVTTMYSDFAYGHSQASGEEIALVRDLMSWTKKPTQLPDVRPGGTASLSLTVVNESATDASSIKLTVLDPNRTIISEQTIGAGVPAGGSGEVPFSYTPAATSPLGIYHVDYTLLDAQGNVIQPQAETDSGRLRKRDIYFIDMVI